jgi:hypothetical protein
VETNESSTGQGAPVEATSRPSTNAPGRRAHTLAEVLDAFMASYAGADPASHRASPSGSAPSAPPAPESTFQYRRNS